MKRTCTYFRNNRVMVSPAHEGGNPKEGDYQFLDIPNVQVKNWFVYRNGNWTRIQYESIPNEIKVLILIGGA